MSISVRGRCIITDELGTIVLDQTNDIHPQNMARVISRALAQEPNHWINSIAFGDDGTSIYGDDIIHKSPNDGMDPDTTEWKSRLYNERYRKIIDDNSIVVGSGVGMDPSLSLPSYPNTLGSNGVVSVDDDTSSRVIIDCELNINEPDNQLVSKEPFTFDEIALFSGQSKSKKSSSQLVDISGPNFNMDASGLKRDSSYHINIRIGSSIQTINIHTPAIGTGINGSISINDLISLLNNNEFNIKVSLLDIQ